MAPVACPRCGLQLAEPCIIDGDRVRAADVEQKPFQHQVLLTREKIERAAAIYRRLDLIEEWRRENSSAIVLLLNSLPVTREQAQALVAHEVLELGHELEQLGIAKAP